MKEGLETELKRCRKDEIKKKGSTHVNVFIL